MKQLRIKRLQASAWQNTLNKINETTCNKLYLAIKGIITRDND